MHPVPPNTPESTRAALCDLVRTRFPGHATGFVERVFAETEALFGGRRPGFQACAMPYHNFAHTCDTVVALVRLLDAHLGNGAAPVLTSRDCELAIAAMLMHDTGFLRRADERAATGAQFSRTHVERGVQVASEVLPGLGVTPVELEFVRLAIRVTAMDVTPAIMERVPAKDRLLAQFVGTADLLGQLAAPDYPDRLADLHREMVEAGLTEGLDEAGFVSQTRAFWEGVAKPRLEGLLGKSYRVLPQQVGNTHSAYLDAIRRNLEAIDRRLAGR